MLLSALTVLASLFFAVAVQSNGTLTSTFKPARPPAIPLAVKNPYLSVWLPAGSKVNNSGLLPGNWPSFYTGQWLGWTGFVRVDGKTFLWMGAPNGYPKANQTSFEYTSTKSIFTIQADGKVEIKVTFLSPITPNDFKRQSLVFSYMQVEVSSIDGSDHKVQLYSDISAEWASGDVASKAEWSTGSTLDGVVYHKVWRQDQQAFSEIKDRAEWGSVYYATESVNGLTTQSGADNDVRGAFNKTGKLDNSRDTKFRAINDKWPVFGYAIDLGSVGSKATSNIFSIGLCQDDAVQFLGKDGLKNQPSLWKDYHNDDLGALSFFYKDYAESSKLSGELDDKIAKDSKAVASDNYAILTSLAVRQAFGATQLVGKKDKNYLFMKEISSNGNTQTIDVIYPSSPIFYYTNPELVKLLLEPHFENQESGKYPNKYAVHDLGTHYPNATGHEDGQEQKMPVEECGNNLIMVLAYVQRTGNTDYIKAHYTILKQWADYLVSSTLLPAEQFSTDDFAGHLVNQTNLALKGIIGIEAMSQISKLIGESGDAQNFTSISHDYIKKWEDMGINKAAEPKHSILNYGNASTYSLLYNLYNDRLLDLKLVNQDIYDMQSAFYPTVKEKYGVPLDTRNRWYTKSDWEIFCAAISSESTRNMFIDSLAQWVNDTPTSKPFTDLYRTNDGAFPPNIEFNTRPVMGAMFALLLMDGGAYKAPPKAVINGTKSSTPGGNANKTENGDRQQSQDKQSGAARIGVWTGSVIFAGVLALMI